MSSPTPSNPATTPDTHPSAPAASTLSETTFDVVVLGAGSTGENVADYAHRGGLSAVMVENDLVGGDCSYWACMPSKALLRSLEALSDARAISGAKQAVTGDVDVQAVLDRRDSFTSHWDDSSQVSWASDNGLAVVRGTARLAGEKTVEVTDPDGTVTTLTARHAVVVCTGSEGAVPPIDGLREAAPWTPRDATSAARAPKRLVILGGGVIGVEMASAWSRLGAEQVTVLERSERVLAPLEPEVGERLTKRLVELGVDVRTGVSATRVVREGSVVTVTLDDGSTVEADEVLVAAGRAARTQDIGLETVGLEPGSWLSVDDTQQVEGFDWLYAAGDVNHRALLTHMGKYQARVCGTVIAARAAGREVGGAWTQFAASADAASVPQVVFSDPPVASVGLTLAAAKKAGKDVTEVSYELGSVAGAALYADDYSGWAQLVVEGDVIVGATFLGAGVTEMVHAATIAIVGRVPLQRLWHAVPSYPTMSEVWLRLLDQVDHG